MAKDSAKNESFTKEQEEEANQYYTSSSAMSCMPSGYAKTKLTMPGYIISEDGYAIFLPSCIRHAFGEVSCLVLDDAEGALSHAYDDVAYGTG